RFSRDWSSDVCSSDLVGRSELISGTWMWVGWPPVVVAVAIAQARAHRGFWHAFGVVLLATHLVWMASAGFFPMPIGEGTESWAQIGRASCRERVGRAA